MTLYLFPVTLFPLCKNSLLVAESNFGTKTLADLGQSQ